jgi:hypothetical protein
MNLILLRKTRKKKNKRIKRKKKKRKKKKEPQKKGKKGKTTWIFYCFCPQNSPRPQERLNWVSST